MHVHAHLDTPQLVLSLGILRLFPPVISAGTGTGSGVGASDVSLLSVFRMEA